MQCERSQKLMVEALYGELDDATRRGLEAHLAGCEACAAEAEALRGALETMSRRDRPDPGRGYWEGFYDRLAERMERESVQTTPAPSWWSRRPARWGYRVAAAAAILLVGVFAGRTFFAPGGPAHQPRVAVDRPGAQEPKGDVPAADDRGAGGEETRPPSEPATDVATTPSRPQRGADAQVASASDRAMRYIEKSQLLLIALVNNDADEPDAYAAGLDEQRRRSRVLVDEADSIREELGDPRQRRLRELVDELQKILIQIANLESDEDMDAVEFIRSRVNDHDVLLKINLEQMRQRSSPDGNAPVDSREADSKRSI